MTEKTIVLPPSSGGNGSDANYRLTLIVPKRRYLSYLRNRWWVVVVCIALAVGAILTYETVRQETYVSSAQLYLTLGPQLGTSIFAEPKDDFATQIELLKGNHLRKAALDKMDPESLTLVKGKLNVDVYRPQATSILQIRVTTGDAGVSQKFLQALIDEYLDFKRQTRLSTTEDVLATLKEDLLNHEAILKSKQEEWAEFQKTNNVSLIQEEARTQSAYLADNEMKVQKLTLELEQMEHELPSLPLIPATNTPVVVSSTNQTTSVTNLVTSTTNSEPSLQLNSEAALKEARIRLDVLKAERDQTIKEHGESAAKLLEKEVAELQRTVDAREDAEAKERGESIQERKKLIALIEDKIPSVKAQVQDLNDKLSQAEKIKSDIQHEQTYYDFLLGKLRDVDLNKNMAQEKVTVLDPPSQGYPDARSLPFRIFLALVGGIFGAMGIVFVWYMFDDRLVSIHDVKDQFGETVLGIVPRVRVKKSRPGDALIQPDDSRAGYVESYRHLRSALLLSSLGEERPQTLLFSGAIPSEGKTTIAVNLARMLAQSGKKVVLVDADLRSGHIHELLGKEPGPGFLDYLRGQVSAKDIIYPTEIEGLFFVPSGTSPEDADRLLSHPNLTELMSEIKDGRDFVILDGAPILSADDASLLVPHADAVVMVMRPYFTHSSQARRVLEMLYQRKAKQVALVFNRAQEEDLAGQYYKENKSARASKNGKV